MTQMRATRQNALERYRRPSRFTDPLHHAERLAVLPDDVAQLAAVCQGLIIHEHLAMHYGVDLAPDRRATVHLRPAARLLDHVDPALPLDTPRQPAERIAGNCRQFTVLMATFLRYRGVPARARCGFGDYFGSGSFEDHWVCEYWDGRWRLCDAQLDEVQQELFGIEFDPIDVPRHRFRVAGDAWRICRDGGDDPSRYGLSFLGEGGMWWIAGNLMRDVAALQNTEVLPWDVWGAMPDPETTLVHPDLALFDQLALLTGEPDTWATELTALSHEDERIRLPASVFNQLRGQPEALDG